MKATIKNAKDSNVNQFLIALMLIASIFVAGCSNSGSGDDSKSDDNAQTETKDSKKKEDEKPPVPVEAVAVARGDIQQTYRTITTLEAEQDVQVVARSSGILQEIFVEEGDKVEKGQILAQLDIEQLSLELAQLKATLQKLEKELKRQKSLFSRKLGSSDALDRARFEYQSQLAQFKLSQLKLNYASIKAPIDGVIVERMVKAGNYISSNNTLFKIVNPASLKAVLHLPEKELANVKKDQLVLLSFDALNNKAVTGKIERIRPAIDTSTGTFKVIASLNNTENLLQIGMFGKVEVVFDTHPNTLLLEQQAVITQDNRSHVFVVKDKKAIQTPVKIGFKQNGVLEITEGLSESDQVITTGQQILKHETRIEVVTLDGKEIEKPSSINDEPKESSISKVATNP
jgi:membrane fusion protein, multidrug efflux system